MTVIIIAAVMTALSVSFLLKPFMKKDSPHRKGAFVLAVLIPLSALGLYLLMGSPDLPSDF